MHSLKTTWLAIASALNLVIPAGHGQPRESLPAPAEHSRALSAPASLHWPQPNSRAEDSLTVFTHALTPSLGFLPTIENQSPDELAGRWRIEPGTNQTVFEDPVTGLRVVRCWKELPGSGFVCLEMMVSNGGTVPLRLTDLRSAEWIFDIADDLKSACYQPLDFRNDTWYGSSYWTGPDWTRVGKDWHHPGENTASIRCFTAPQDGRVSITGRIYKADTNGGDGVAPAIRHGNRTVWEAVIGPRDSVGIEPQVSFRVHQGETIRFVVSKRGQIACDTTHWNPLITYDNGRRFLASEGFSGTATGGIWSYEMELASPILTNWPNIHFLGADLLARAQTIRPGIPVAIDNHSALPLLVLAGCANHSGLLLAPATERDWHLDASLSDSGKLRLTVCEGGTRKSLVLAPGESVPLVSLLCGVYNGSWEQGAGIWRHTIQVQGRNAEVALLGRLVAAACERESARLEAASVRLRLSHANLFVPPARLVCRFPPSKSELNRPAIESRTRCYFGGSWSVPELAAASRSVNQEQINTVAGLRDSLSPVLGGNYFRPLPLPLNDHQWDAQQFQSADASRGILVVFRAKSQNDEQPVRWVHLQPKASYRVWDTAGNDTAVHTGEDLMSQGLLFSLPSEGSRLLGYEVTQVRSTPIPIPSAPPSLIVQATGPQSIRLSWPSVAGAMVYVIRRDGEVLARVTDAHEYCDRDLEPAQTCRYAVAAEAGLIRSPWTFGWGTTLNSQGATRVVRRPNLDLWEMIEADWRRQDKITDSTESCFHGLTNALARARLLLAELRPALPVDFVTQETGELDRLDQLVKTSNNKAIGWRGLYLRARWLNREIALANPLMDFGKLLFVKRIPTSYSHLVMQYFGWRARPGGGLFVAEKPGYSLEVRDLLDGRLASGSVLEPRLSPDAKRIVFSYSKCTPDDPFFHICEVHTDGTGFRQLTSGEYEDLMPEYLPDGGIIFSSTRRRGYARCFGSQFGKRWHVYALHRMGADGKNIRPLSFHDTNEWFPAVSNSGRVLYARWDYIDRDAVTHQNLWSIRPDGSDPMVVWGNATASPHCSFQAQPIPGSPKIVFTASAHHSMTAGSIVVLNPEVSIDGHQAITRITPEVCFPEAEGSPAEYYQSPWPLSENFFLVAYSPYPLLFEPAANEPAALGVYLLDRFGNRELIYRDPAIGSTSPMPLAPRPCPPICASTLPSQAPPTGEMILMNVYEGLGEIEHGTITALRIIQILPKTTPEADNPPVGLAREENARAILGTVKVESDGSAQFMVPAGKPLLFQALDKNGFAYQTMRTTTYVQPGERVSCIGCHESRLSAPRSGSPVLALRREPSHIEPEMDGTRPFSFVRLVQPILNRYCIQCHSGPKPELGIDLTAAPWRGFTRSYWSLCGDRDFWGNGTGPKNAAEALVPRFGGRNQIQVTPPGGVYGARGSRLMKLLRAGHAGLQLSPEEIRRLAIWIDANAVFYGVYDPIQQAVQLEGKAVPMPEVE